MKEYCKNGNEYMLDGKRYVEEIRTCSIEWKQGDEYIFNCGIKERGERTYTVKEDCLYLKERGNKGFWLPDNLILRLKQLIQAYNENIDEIKRDAYHINVAEAGAECWFKKTADDSYDVVCEYADVERGTIVQIYEDLTYLKLIDTFADGLSFPRRKIGHQDGDEYEKQIDLYEVAKQIRGPRTREALYVNPFYKYCAETGDEKMQLALKLWNNLVTEEECSRIAILSGRKILPPFPPGNKDTYYINANEIDHKLMTDSCYNLLHRANICMRGSTRRIYTIHPYERTAVDAAPEDCETISFEAFIALYDKSSES